MYMEFTFNITNDIKKEMFQDAVDRISSASITISSDTVYLELESLGAVDSYWDVWRQVQTIAENTDLTEEKQKLAVELAEELNSKFEDE